MVFDSSATYEEVSLNGVLLTGPDHNNSLLGVLTRFRKEQVAITADKPLPKDMEMDLIRWRWKQVQNLADTFLE